MMMYHTSPLHPDIIGISVSVHVSGYRAEDMS